ncbi:MAG: hypothetical protein A3B70_01545 [Deltaproteobacteria bacterium RIFCSPHIGHO2_02_FULL_40_11]|nr:MAG: hypothetical protein A3B70_01545 [Deltaproteobacteria bacterium RIFCSPHIGHO2_02_FULL_40_11]
MRHTKKIITGLLVSLGLTALVNAETVTLSKREVTLNVDISTTTLRLSRADYASPLVKVLVPDLADVTILDHRNTGEGAPCLATFDTMFPNDVIQDNPQVEKIKFDIVLKKEVQLNSEGTACMVHLLESVHGRIRGFQFEHYQALFVGERHIDDCR